MNHLDYLDFELEIGQPTGQEYPLTVLRSPAGEARATLIWPFGELALANRLKDLQIALLSSGGGRRTVLTPAEEAVQRFGAELFDLLFTGEVRNRYDVSQERVHHQGKGLRVKLRIQAPLLANLPWEFLYDPRRAEYISLSQQTPVVRYLELPQTIRPLVVTPPLRILGMVASPTDLQMLDVGVERQRLERALAPLQDKGLVQLHWLEGTTWRDLQRAMRREQWHIFHFVGHGDFDPRREEGLIAFCNDAAKAHLLTAGDLGRLLGDHRTLRLAVLNACLGAQGSNRDLFSSTAATLVQRGILAVVAMQQAITDAAAIEFTQTFYESLADGLPVDAAMGEARKAISFAVTNTLEWGTPVLYSRASDGLLFTVASLPSTSSGNERSALAEREPTGREAERGSSVYSVGMQGVDEDLPGRGEDDQQNKEPSIAPARPVDDARPFVTKRIAPVSRWRQPGILATLSIVLLLLGVLGFRTQLAALFGSATNGEPGDSPTVVVTTPTQATAVSLLLSVTPTPTNTIDGEATAAVIAAATAEAAAVATTTANQIATNEAAALTALPTATLTAPPPPTATATATATPTFTPTPRPADGDKFTLDAFAMTFAYVSAGPFTMGSPSGEGSDEEHPQHEMPVDAFWIGLTEVTNAQYQHFIDAKGYDNQAWWTDAGWQWRTENKIDRPVYWADEKWNGANQPVVGVSWYEAIAYATWLAAETGLVIDLPTEAQWEKTARGTDGHIYPWGNEPPNDQLLNYNNEVGKTVEVGSYPDGVSPYGALDMAGNVWEWTATKWVATYVNYGTVVDNNKEGDVARALRGGSWRYFSTSGVRSAIRGKYGPFVRDSNLGFRIVLVPEF